MVRLLDRLTFRALAGSLVFSLLIGGAFATLLGAISNFRCTTSQARQAKQAMAAGNDLARLVVGLELDQRGFLRTGDSQLLEQRAVTRSKFNARATGLQELTATQSISQRNQAGRIVRDGESYLQDYSDPVVRAARRNPASAMTVGIAREGKRRIDQLSEEIGEFSASEQASAAGYERRTAEAARQAIGGAAGGIAGSILLIPLFSGWLLRGVIRPVRRASAMADRLAGGDLTVRIPETGQGEVAALESSLNAMAHSFETSRGELGKIAAVQASLRRVATLVARAGQPAEVFEAVAREVGRLLKADHTAICRFGSDTCVTVTGSWAAHSEPSRRIPVGSRWSLNGDNTSALVLNTGRHAHMTFDRNSVGEIAEWARQQGIHSCVGSPVMVEGYLWGVIVAAWDTLEPQSSDVQDRMDDFTGLLATAIANTDSRTELTASRTRLVKASDEARRRIERDLHDGTQQRLVALGLGLQNAKAHVPHGHESLERQLTQMAHDLTDIIDNLREVSRGIHPAILTQGGLGPALKALARRSRIPVELRVNVDHQLPEQVEVAAYYVTSEALTNATKHAHASSVQVDVDMDQTKISLSIKDDGVGGADPDRGTGLIGLKDRVEALGGKIDVTSPAGAGTTLLVQIPN